MRSLRKNHFIHIFTFLMTFVLAVIFFRPKTLAAPSRLVFQGDTNDKEVALTFDDGSNEENFNHILDILNQHNVKASFYINGNAAEVYPNPVERAASEGHEIGNHSYSHADFTTLSKSEIENELTRTDNILSDLTAKTTKPYFRPPYGAFNDNVLSIVGDAGYDYSLYWTIDTMDWAGYSADTIYNEVMDNMAPGAIVLMHANTGAANTAQALDAIIPALKEQGYQFVTISQMLNEKPDEGGGEETYTVQSGDTLGAIAAYFNTTVDALAVANNITDINQLSVGQVLVIPSSGNGGETTPEPNPQPGITYTVQSGDTLSAIASRHNRTVAEIADANNITDINQLSVGQVLTIPAEVSQSVVDARDISTLTHVHRVQSGENLYRIALKYDTTVANLVQYNQLTDPSVIYIGQMLFIK